MAFVIEKIPEDKIEEYGELGSMWVIDHDKNAFFNKTGGGRENYSHYALHWDSLITKISLTYIEKPREREPGQKNIYDLELHLYEVEAPEALQDKVPELFDLIEKALVAYGWCCVPEKTGTVIIDNIQEQRLHFV